MGEEERSAAPASEFEGRVRLYWGKLSRTERQIAEYILKNEDAVSRMSIQALAKAAGVGAASAIRLSKALGYRGFAEMKFYLDRKKMLVDQRDVGISRTDPNNVVKQKILQFDYSVLERCVLDLSCDTLERISEAIIRAGKVFIIGCGAASGVAQTGAALFMALGVSAFSVNDPMLQLRSAAFLSPGDVLIALCYSGYSKEIGDTMFFAREMGAVSLLITSYKDSLLGKYADYELFTPVRNRDNSINASSTVIGQIVMLQIIQAIIWQKEMPAISEKSAQLRGHSDMTYYDVKQETIRRGRVRIVEREEETQPV